MDPPKLIGEKTMMMDVEQMSDTPKRGSHHRRAHSDTSFRLDDLLLFDPSDLDLTSLDLPTPTPPGESPASHGYNGGPNPKPRPISHHHRSFSVDSDFFDGLSLNASGGRGDEKSGGGEKRVHHRHSASMDGSSTTSFEVESLMIDDGAKKAMAPDRLAELALIDPKRAKRILANRQSAARSKERKIRYTGELERKVQTLQSEATTLSAQVTMLQRDTTGLTAENKELKLRLQAMEQQAHLRDALSETLKEEVQRLKITAGQIPVVNGNPFGRVFTPQFPSHPATSHHFGSSPPQQPQQQQQQQQLHIPQRQSTNNQSPNGQPRQVFANFK